MKWQLSKFAAPVIGVVICGWLSGGVSAQPSAPGTTGAPMVLVQRIPLPNVAGRMDHLGIDLEGHRLFAAALGENQNTVEVVDLQAGKRVFSIRGLSRPQGIYYSVEFNRLFVSSGGDGTYKVFRGDGFKLLESVPLGINPNHVGYDPATEYLYVGYRSDVSGLLGIIDTRTGKEIGQITTDAQPGGIKIESAGSRIFVTLLGNNKIGVVDRQKRMQVTTWPISHTIAALALDERDHRLFGGGRDPPKLTVFDTDTGRQIAELDCVSGIDDLWYDAARKRIYATGIDGLAVYDQKDADHYTLIAKLASSPGAATSIWVPALDRLFVSAPKEGNRNAAILVLKPPQ